MLPEWFLVLQYWVGIAGVSLLALVLAWMLWDVLFGSEHL